MGWSFSVALPPDAAPCHRAADALRAVGRAAADAADFLDGQAATSGEHFRGVAAGSYRAASAVLGADARGVADDAHALAAALDDYATRIGGVRRELVRVRDAAVEAGLEVTADEQVLWTPVPGTPIDDAYERLEARATGAHAETRAACDSWWRAVHRSTTGPLAPTIPVDDLPPRADQPTSQTDQPTDQTDQPTDQTDPSTDPSPAPQPAPAAPTISTISTTSPDLPDPAAGPGPGSDPAPRPTYPLPMVAASSAPLPPPLLLPLPAANAPCPDGFEGVLT